MCLCVREGEIENIYKKKTKCKLMSERLYIYIYIYILREREREREREEF